MGHSHGLRAGTRVSSFCSRRFLLLNVPFGKLTVSSVCFLKTIQEEGPYTLVDILETVQVSQDSFPPRMLMTHILQSWRHR